MNADEPHDRRAVLEQRVRLRQDEVARYRGVGRHP